MKKILMEPTVKRGNNTYMNNLYNTIKDSYEVAGGDEVNEEEKYNYDIYHLNWYESNYQKDKKKDKEITNYKKKEIIKLKEMDKKIIWTVHNNVPHNAINKRQTLKFMKFLAKQSDRIHILCKETVNNNKYLKKYKDKIVCIHHGDYIGNYGTSNIDIFEKHGIPKDKKIILFVGQVKKYKNIEILIKAFKNSKLKNDNYVLLICGKCSDESYKEEIEKTLDNNIIFYPCFIEDEEMGSYLEQSKMVIAPYNKQSSLNSGTLWMAMSYKKTMMIPLIGSVKDIENYNDFLYVYDYKNNKDHYIKLLECMNKLNIDLNQDKEILNKKGEEAYKYMVENQTWKIEKQKWIDLYKF